LILSFLEVVHQFQEGQDQDHARDHDLEEVVHQSQEENHVQDHDLDHNRADEYTQ